MKTKRVLLALTIATACWTTADGAAAEGAIAQGAHPDDRAALKQIVDDYWQHQIEESPSLRQRNGLPVERLPDVSFAAAERDAAFARDMLGRLEKIHADALAHDDQLSLQILRWEAEQAAAAVTFYWLRVPVTPYASPIREAAQIFPTHPLRNEGDLERYLTLLGQIPAFIDNIRGILSEQRGRAIVLPVAEIDLVVPFIRSFIHPPDQSTFAVNAARVSALDVQRAAAFRERVQETIGAAINPSLERLVAYVDGEYRKSAPQAVGLSQYPGGKEYYRYLVKLHTTLDVTPEDVHQIGMQEVERTEKKMAEARAALGFTGSKADFTRSLKTDPQLIPKTPDQIGERLMSLVAPIAPLIPRYFLRTPRAPYGVKRLDPSLEGAMTFGYYGLPTPADPKGNYFYNGSQLEQRSLLTAGSLIYHELVPGHHFQIALQLENESLPAFRREGGHSAFTEGWGEYSSALAGEMGLYDTGRYDRYGRLAMEMFFGVRLVVDTGMNYMGWSREKAVAFMKEHLLDSDLQIHTESLRYSTDIPGQALAYGMGRRKIQELREHAREQLGARFDIRKFHDAVLGSGSMPLAVLERHIAWFIKREKQGS